MGKLTSLLGRVAAGEGPRAKPRGRGWRLESCRREVKVARKIPGTWGYHPRRTASRRSPDRGATRLRQLLLIHKISHEGMARVSEP